MADNDVTLSPEQEQMLRHEAFIARVLNERKPASSPDALRPWQQFLESTGGAALITAVIVGIFGALISSMFQSSAKEREFQQAWLKARGDQAMVAFKDFVDRREDFVKTLFDQIGSSQTSAEDYISLTKDRMAIANYEEPNARKQISELRNIIKGNFDINRGKWRSERGKFGLSISYYYPVKQDPAAAQYNVPAAWQDLSNALTRHMDCADKWVEENLRKDDTSQACITETNSLNAAIAKLAIALDHNRTYVWEGWESPEKLRKALDQK